MARALILTYHAVESGPAPLCADPVLFAEHMDVVARSGARSLTIRTLADAIRTRSLEANSVAVTFDDGFASVAENAIPALSAHCLTATVFCVAMHLGGMSNWPSARQDTYRSRLADSSTLAEVAAAGFEIGSHGMEHAPLAGASERALRRELTESRAVLEDAVEEPVTSYAYPYGAMPGGLGRKLVAQTYDAACATSLGRASGRSDIYALPRIDAYYLRDPELLRRALSGGLGGYFRARGVAARARRTLVKDYARSATPA